MDESSIIINTIEEKRNITKWNLLFERNISYWMSVQPAENTLVYICYSCRDVFGRKNSFLDHINRRGMLIEYFCPYCPQKRSLVFYNPCSLLLHARDHFTGPEAEINLDDLNISLLPLGLAGIFLNSKIPQLYDVAEDVIGNNNCINTNFYTPSAECRGKRIITFRSYILLYIKPPDNLFLKQISSNVPLCKFVKYTNAQFEKKTEVNLSNCTFNSNLSGRDEEMESNNEEIIWNEFNAAVKTNDFNIESPVKTLNFAKCPECNVVQECTMTEHFIGNNKPINENFKCSICKYVAASLCSLKAHERIHSFSSPFVCPECGKNFESVSLFKEHLEELCFHLAKQVRFKCPGRGCRKVFATYFSFSNHFNLHLSTYFKCALCNFIADMKSEFLEHLETNHDISAISPIHEYFQCKHCSFTLPFSKSVYSEHIHSHCNNSELKIYVYVCKHCKAVCRTRENYALHLLRCIKNIKNASYECKELITTKTSSNIQVCFTSSCKFCDLVFINRDKYINHLFQCVGISSENYKQIINDYSSYSNTLLNSSLELKKRKLSLKLGTNEQNDGLIICILCKESFSSMDLEKHLQNNTVKDSTLENSSTIKTCRYLKPIVLLNETVTTFTHNRKRIKSILTSTKYKESLENADVLKESENTLEFNDTYFCKICNYDDINRNSFHIHITQHRNSSTPYQCMDCGESFPDKISLRSHLYGIHKILDVDSYFKNNNCFIENEINTALKEKTDNPGETNLSPLQENQCKVCRNEFNNDFELTKHLRMHGMAFLSISKK